MGLKEDLEAANTVAWIIGQGFVTEVGKPFEFFDHRFLLGYLADTHRQKVSKKSSQIGETVGELFDDFHLAIHEHMNVIHTLHNNDVLSGFVTPKVNPLILRNKAISRYLSKDSEGLKSFGENFVFFRGANSESQAISISADVLKIDEEDRSKPGVVEMFYSRLDASPHKLIRSFSNPSSKGYGVDEKYSRSDQREWFVDCHHCNHYMYMGFEQTSELNHYVNQEREIYACGNCHRELSTSDRTNGDWEVKWPSRSDKIHGYHFSQMMAPWFSAAEILDKFRTTSTEYFHNFVLGEAYTQADLLIDRETILQALRSGSPRKTGNVMGSDIGKPHWYWIGNSNGVFKWGRADSWDDLEYLFNFYQCEAWVMDSMPEMTQVQIMLKKYPGKAFACQFNKDRAELGMVRWQTGDKRGFVYADRTRVIDRTVTELGNGSIPIYGNASDVAEFITHASNMYRSVETDEKGLTKIDWMTIRKPDHLVLALVYWRIALEKVFSGLNSGVVQLQSANGRATSPTVIDGKITHQLDVAESIERAKV